jgi:hypothetical protein
MVLDEDPLPDNKPRYKFQSPLRPFQYFRGETLPPAHSQNSVSAVDVDGDGHRHVGSGSSYGYESAIGTSRTPIEAQFPSFQPREKAALSVDDDMRIGSFGDSPPEPFNSTLFNGNHLKTSSPLQDSQISHHPTAFSNVDLLQDFLAHRAATGYQYANHPTKTPAIPVEIAQITEESFEARPGEPSADTEWPTLPPELLSKIIGIPEEWNVPNSRHRYLASLPFLQRRALVQKLKEDCSVEVQDAIEGDIIVDTHTATILTPRRTRIFTILRHGLFIT